MSLLMEDLIKQCLQESGWNILTTTSTITTNTNNDTTGMKLSFTIPVHITDMIVHLRRVIAHMTYVIDQSDAQCKCPNNIQYKLSFDASKRYYVITFFYQHRQKPTKSNICLPWV